MYLVSFSTCHNHISTRLIYISINLISCRINLSRVIANHVLFSGNLGRFRSNHKIVSIILDFVRISFYLALNLKPNPYLSTTKTLKVMTNQQESRLSMYLSFRDYQAGFTAISTPLPNYTTNSTTFVNTIPQIQAVAEQQKISKKGVTDNKNILKENLIVTTADYARKLGVYAKFTNNATLAQEVKFTEGKLRQVADTAVKDYAQIVYDRAQPIVASLATYGITAATQTALLAAITAYNASIGKPSVSRTESSQITKQLETLFKTAETALANMDAAVEIVRISQPAFYTGYKNARKIVETGIGTLAVKGLVTDAKTGEPVKGATLSFALDGNNGMAKTAKASTESVVKKTAEKGGFNIKSLPSGMYTVTIKKVGYADQVATVAVADGELTEVNIQLSKS